MKKKEKEEKLHIQNQVATSLQSFQVFFHLHTISHGLYLPLYLPLSLSLFIHPPILSLSHLHTLNPSAASSKQVASKRL